MSTPVLPAPGFSGGFYWRAVFVALLVLLIGNVVATQYAAHQFGYQPALGEPLARLPRIAVYQPFSWMSWSRWLIEFDVPATVRRPLLQANGIALLGAITAVAAFMLTQHRRGSSAAREARDLHGSAKWATKRDLERSGLLKARQGIYVGAWPNGSGLQYLRHNGPEHVLAFAPTRSGKGVALVIPTLLGSWFESVLVYDIKGENWAKTSGYRSTLGPCFRFAPASAESNRFNPLAEIRLNTDRDVADTMNVAKMLIHDGVNAHEPYWHEAGESLLTGVILHACYVADREGRVACLRDVHDLLNTPGVSFRETLRGMLTTPHLADGRVHPTVAQKAQETCDKEDRNFDGVVSTAKTALKLYSDPIVARNTSASDFRINDLVNHENPVALYLIVPAGDQQRLRPLTRLIFTLVVNRLTEAMRFDGAEMVPNRHRLLFLIDEFPSLRRMPVFADALSYMAGYGMKAFLIAQDIRQIEDSYGGKESIVSNCHVRVAFAPNTHETARLLSEMTGRQTVLHTRFSFSGKRSMPLMNNVSTSMDHFERPLLTADEITRLKSPRKEGEGTGERIVEPGEALIFVAGQRPVLCTQMLYFFDPELSRRAGLKPPVRLVSIDSSGFVVDQPVVTRTENVLSRVETPPQEAAPVLEAVTTAAEQELDPLWPV